MRIWIFVLSRKGLDKDILCSLVWIQTSQISNHGHFVTHNRSAQCLQQDIFMMLFEIKCTVVTLCMTVFHAEIFFTFTHCITNLQFHTAPFHTTALRFRGHEFTYRSGNFGFIFTHSPSECRSGICLQVRHGGIVLKV